MQSDDEGETPGRVYARAPVLGRDNSNDSFFVAAMQHPLAFESAAPLTVRAIVTLPETGRRAHTVCVNRLDRRQLEWWPMVENMVRRFGADIGTVGYVL